MTSFARLVVGVCILLGFAAAAPQTAAADCDDRANRGVEWRLCNKAGVSLVGEDITQVKIFGADLSGANLTGANLEGAGASSANLTNATLTNANLSKAALFRTRLRGTNLVGADLTGAVLVQADLSGANLTGANLTGANLLGADLKNVKLAGANLGNATWVDGTTCAEGSVGSCNDPSSVDVATNQRVSGAVNQVFVVADFLADRGPDKRMKKVAFRALLNDAVDMDVIRRMAVGRYWKKFTEEEREEYSGLFTEFLVDAFAHYYAKGSQNYLEVVSIKVYPNRGDIIKVETHILNDGGGYSAWDWTVRSKDGEHKIVDAVDHRTFRYTDVGSELTNITIRFGTLLDEGDGTANPLLSYLRTSAQSFAEYVTY